MKLLLTCLLFTIPFFSFAQSGANYAMLDSTANAILHRNKSADYMSHAHTELTSIERTPENGLKLMFKKLEGNATSYDYETYFFDKDDKCKMMTSTSSLGRLNIFLPSLREMGYRTSGDNVYYNADGTIRAKMETNVTRKIFTVTFTKK